jgi:excisionase family DNA binding protein
MTRTRRLVQVPVIAGEFGISTRTVYRLAKSGEIPSYRVGRQLRFDPAEVGIALRGQAA